VISEELDRLDSVVERHDLCFVEGKDRFDHLKFLIILRPKPVFTELDRQPNDPELVEHVLVVCYILRRALAEAMHQGHDSVFGVDILNEDGGSKARWDSGEGEKAGDVLA